MISAAGLRARSAVLWSLRQWFAQHGYLEVHTPCRVVSPAMEEHLFAFEVDGLFLRTSPEFALKKVLAHGLPRIYEIGPCWRDRESGPWHGSEFTMLEWYRAGASLDDLMDEVESIVVHCAQALGRPPPSEWTRTTVRDVFLKATGIDIAHASARDLSDSDDAWDDAFFRRWVSDVEPTLTGPLFIRDWPASQAALSQVRDDGPYPVASRFEAYLGGVELANAFDELIDPVEQRRRATASIASRLASGELPHPPDPELFDAVGRMPRTSGIALGVDRLLAALMNWDGIAPGRAG